MYTDADGRPGEAFRTENPDRVTLERDGIPVAGNGFFEVPPDPADYILTEVVHGPTRFTYSTQVSAQWRFRSGHRDATTLVALPLSVVHFTPTLDNAGTAAAGVTFPIPVSVEKQDGSSATANASLQVDVSYDDGATWTAVPVRTSNGTATAILQHPTTPAFVSLRATAVDTTGNSVKQTILRAYQTK